MKKILALVLCFCMLGVTANAASMQFAIGDTQVKTMDAQRVTTEKAVETAPFTVDGRTMVPVRVIAENFGAQVGWDDATQTVTISAGATVITLTIGSNLATVNGEGVTLDVAAIEQNGRTLVPLRFISEVLGYAVKYIPSTQQIYITDSPVVMKTKYSAVTLEEFGVFYALVRSNFLPPDITASEEVIVDYVVKMTVALLETILPVYDYLIYEGGGFDEAVYDSVREEVNSFLPYADKFGVLPSVYASCMEMFSSGDERIFYELVGEKEVQNAYESLYLCAKHILIPTVDLQTGASLSEEEVLAAEALANDLCVQIAAGADFDALMQQYSQDGGMQVNPDGYVFTVGEMVDEFYNGAIALQVGEVSAPVQSVFGYHIIKRMPLPAMEEARYEECRTIALNIWMREVMEKNPPELLIPNETLVEYLK